MRKNLSLLIGIVIVSLLTVVMICPQWITDINPYGTELLKYQDANGHDILNSPPFPPGPDSLLGTDQMGRDVLSLIVYGTRLTIALGLLVVLGRYLIALPLGLAAGFGSYVARALINQFNVTFSAIPALIISIIVLKMPYFTNLDKQRSAWAFIVVLTVVGWSRLSLIIAERVQEILARPFIKGEVAIGKSNWRIALENVIPHLVPELVVLFFMEIAAALTMIMQLGIFTVFIGNLKFVKDSFAGGVYSYIPISFEPEWASMLAAARKYTQSAPWLVISPAIAFFISIVGFNMLGEGLRAVLQRRGSRFTVGLRTFLGSTLKWGRKGLRKPALAAAVLAISLVTLLLVFSYHSRFNPGFAAQAASPPYRAPQFEQVIIGTEQAKLTAEGIAQAFQQLGLAPMDEKQGFIINYPTPELYGISSARLEMSSNNQSQIFAHGRDYAVVSFGDRDISGGVYDARLEDLYSLDYTRLSGKFVLLDSKLYPGRAAVDLAAKIMDNSAAVGVFCINTPGQELPGEIGNQQYRGAVLWISSDAAERIVKARTPVINLSIRSQKLINQGRNIMGVLKGQDTKMDKESILIGLAYNYQVGQQEIGRKRILFGLELAKQLQKVKKNRNIIFAFWDGSISPEYNGLRYYAQHTIISPNKISLHLDLSQLNADFADSLYIRTDQAPIGSYFGFSIGHQLEERIREYGLPLENYNPPPSDDRSIERSIEETMTYATGIPTIIVKTGTSPGPKKSRGVALDSLGQVLLETLTKNSY